MKILQKYISLILLFTALAVSGCAASYNFQTHWLSRIENLADTKKTGDAGFEIIAYLKAFPGDIRPLIIMGRMEGLPEYKGVLLAGRPNGPWYDWMEGAEAEARGDLKTALESYRKAYEAAPMERLIAERYANLLLKTGSYKEAEEIVLLIMGDMKNEAPPYKRTSGIIGYGMTLNGMASEASDALFERMGEANLDNDFYSALALSYYKQKKYDLAVNIFETADSEGKLSKEFRDVYKSAIHRQLLSLRQLKLFSSGEHLAKKAEGIFPDEAVMHAHRALFLMEMGRSDEAGGEFRAALDENPYNLDAVQAARLFYITRGKPFDAFKTWERAVPADVVFSEENLVKPLIDRIRSLSEIIQAAPDEKTAEHLEKKQMELARTMRDFGWLREARAEYMLVLDANPQNREAQLECREIAGHMKALADIEEYFNKHYDAMIEGKASKGIRDVLQDLEEIIGRSAGAKVSGGCLWSAVFVGSEMNPMTCPDNPVVKYFQKYNQYIDLQEPYSQYPECKIMNLVARFKRSAKYAGGSVEFEEYICDEDWVKAMAGYISGRPRVAGSTSYSSKGFYLDMAAIRPSMQYLRSFMGEKRKSESGYDEFAATLRNIAQEKDVPRFSFELQDNLYADARKSLGIPDGATLDNAFQTLFKAELGGVAAHELGHLKDFFGVVPFFAHLFGNIWIAISNGLSAENITSRFESVAYANSVAESPAPSLVLASEMDWLEKFSEKTYVEVLLILPTENVETSPYHRSAIITYETLVEFLRENGAKYPGVDMAGDLFMQIYKIPENELRRAAREYLGAPSE